MSGASSNFVDYATLGAAAIGAVGVILNWWHERSKKNERFDVGLDWNWGHDHFGGQDDFPYVIVHNRSEDAIAIKDVVSYSGWGIRRRGRYTALDWLDPSDLTFPYFVEPGQLWKKRISNHNFVDDLEKVRFASMAWKLKRPSLWIGVETMRGSMRFSNAQIMIESKNRPVWLKPKGDE